LSSSEPSTKVGPLDLSDPKDLALLRKLATDGPGKKKKRWEGITDEFKANAVRALQAALHMAVEKKNPRDITRCVEVVAKIEGQNQADEHLDRKELMVTTIKHTGHDGGAIQIETAVADAIMGSPELHAAAVLIAQSVAASVKPPEME